MGRELYISDAYGRAFSASPQREAPDSFPFATYAAPCHSWISRFLFPASNHIPRRFPGSRCSHLLLTKRHSHSPSGISLQNPFANSNLFRPSWSSASVHPISLTARSPLVKCYEIYCPLPVARPITHYLCTMPHFGLVTVPHILSPSTSTPSHHSSSIKYVSFTAQPAIMSIANPAWLDLSHSYPFSVTS